jgi:hypothetical protein
VPPPEEVEPRFHSCAMGYYTQAAIADALKPGGMVTIHPYVLAKLRGDPHFIGSASPEVRVRLLRMWRGATVAAMNTEEIEARLTIMGAVHDRDTLVVRARAHDKQSAWEIGME